MTWWQALVLGIVQGLAEFLPISSSGHLVLFRQIMGISGNFLLFDTIVHVGTVFAIFVVFFKELLGLFKPPFKTIGLILLASVPAIIVAVLFNDKVESFFSTAKYICFFFAGSAILMLLTEIIGKRIKEPKPVGIKTALFMGGMQAVALFPGLTRSGSTLFGGISSGGERVGVAKFSFFMSIPVILGAAFLQTLDMALGKSNNVPVNWWCYLIGAVTAFVCGFVAIKFMLKLIAKANFKWFSLYLGILSIVTFLTCFLEVF